MISEFHIDKLKGHQCRAIFSMLGIKRGIPAPVREKREKLKGHWRRDPEAFQKLYEAAVLGKIPDEEKQVIVQEKEIDTEKLLTELTQRIEHNIPTLATALYSSVEEKLEKNVDQLIAKAAVKYRPVEIVQEGGKRKKLTKEVLPAEFDRILQLASQRVNVMMVGPAGCGKTFLAGKVAEALGLDFGSISCSAGMSESQLAGWLLPVGAGGKFEYVPSDFVNKYEKGGVYLFDEIDASDPNVTTFINQAIANGSFSIPQRYKNPLVKKHKDFVCIAAANTYGNGADAMYVGRNQLDAATLDRFRAGMITMDYSDIVEKSLVAPEVYEWGIAIRNVIKAHRMRRIMSTRVMLDITKMTAAYKWTVEDWDRTYFTDWSDQEISKARIELGRSIIR